MQRFEVKRHVARQALADLEDMGLVVRQLHRGASSARTCSFTGHFSPLAATRR